MNKTFVTLLIFFSFVLGTYADSNGIWTYVSDLRPGIFGSDENDNTTSYVFENPLEANNNFMVFGDNVSIGDTNSDVSLIGNVTINEKDVATQEYVETYTYNKTEIEALIAAAAGGSIPNTTTGDNLVYEQHTKTQCSALGGSVFDVLGDEACLFNAGSCPAGWAQLRYWSATTSQTCVKMCGKGAKACTTGGHVLSDVPQESCVYCTRGGTSTCYATVTQVVCY